MLRGHVADKGAIAWMSHMGSILHNILNSFLQQNLIFDMKVLCLRCACTCIYKVNLLKELSNGSTYRDWKVFMECFHNCFGNSL